MPENGCRAQPRWGRWIAGGWTFCRLSCSMSSGICSRIQVVVSKRSTVHVVTFETIENVVCLRSDVRNGWHNSVGLVIWYRKTIEKGCSEQPSLIPAHPIMIFPEQPSLISERGRGHSYHLMSTLQKRCTSAFRCSKPVIQQWCVRWLNLRNGQKRRDRVPTTHKRSVVTAARRMWTEKHSSKYGWKVGVRVNNKFVQMRQWIPGSAGPNPRFRGSSGSDKIDGSILKT